MASAYCTELCSRLFCCETTLTGSVDALEQLTYAEFFDRVKTCIESPKCNCTRDCARIVAGIKQLLKFF